MQNNIRRQATAYAARKRRHRVWTKVVTALACLVVFCTTYALILPALTMTAPTELDCDYQTLGVHVHDRHCYDQDGNLICGYADFVVHTHNADCYDQDGNLVCALPEIQAHTHTRDCFAETYELICGLEESEGHVHTDDCYQDVYDEEGNLISRDLVCELEESEGHTHTDACYALQLELVCGKDEIILHTHTDDCYDEYGNLICGQLEVLEHIHNDYCFVPVEAEPEEEPEAFEEPEEESELPEDPEESEQPEEPEESEESEEAEEPEAEPVVYVPAQVFRGQSGGVVVNVNAPEGAFPDKTVMSVTPASDEAIQAAADALDTDASNVQAVDITFRTADGVEIEPAIPVYVTMQSALVAQAGDAVVVHVDDNAQAQIVEDTSTGRTTVSFEADAFSVYAIVPETDERYIYEFYVAEDVKDEDGNVTGTITKLVETQIITAGDTLTRPEAPNVPSQYTDFAGWYIGGEKNADTGVWEDGNQLTFGMLDANALKNALETYRDTSEYQSDLKEDPNASSVKVVKVHARFAYKVTVTFMMTGRTMEGNDVNEIITTKRVVPGGEVNIKGVTAVSPFSGMGFVGWSESDYTDTNRVTLTDDTYTPQKDTILYAVFKEGTTLTFDNGEDATHTTSQFVAAGSVTRRPGSNPTRPGYTFEDWYTGTKDENGNVTYDTTSFVFGGVLTENTTIYAKWTANDDVKYTVVFWYENADDTEYSYAGYASKIGTAGSTISSGTFQNEAFAGRDADHFTYNGGLAETKTIAGDGSTVLNVYFTRKTYTLTFATDSKTYENSTNVITYGSITAKYQANIGNQWPVPGETMTGGTVAVPSNLTRWSVTKVGASSATTQATKLDTMTAEYCSDAGIEFHARIATDTKNFTINYMMESLDGKGTEYDGTYYKNDDRYSQTLVYPSTQTSWNAKEIDGFTAVTEKVNFDSNDVANLYYTRKRNDITFNDNHGNVTATISDVMFEMPLSDITYNGESISEIKPNYYDAAAADYYEFKGWYTTEECFEGTEAKFGEGVTMPNAPLTFYAKWEPKTVTVTYDPNGGWFWDNSTSPTTREIPYNTVATELNMTGNNDEIYSFVAWYYINELGEEEPWNFDNLVTADLILTAKWYSDVAVNIVYKVRVTETNDDGEVTVTWDENEVKDESIYLDGAEVAVKEYVTDEDFVGWRLGVQSSAEDGKYNDMTGTFYAPGDFLIVSEAADLADGAVDDEGNLLHDKTIVLYAVYYTPPTVGLTFDANDGKFSTTDENGATKTFDQYVLTNLTNNGGVDLDEIPTPTRTGYKFLGWANGTDSTAADYEVYTADGKDSKEIYVDNDGTNVLYAVWEELVTLKISKVDAADQAATLEGAQFVLTYTETDENDASTQYYFSTNNTWVTLQAGETEADYARTTDEDGSITFTRALDRGNTYTLKEIKAPDGYNLPAGDVTISVTSEGEPTSNGNTVTKNDDGSYTITVTNSAGQSLPNTGGVGTQVYIYSGLLMIAAAVMCECIVRRRRERRQR